MSAKIVITFEQLKSGEEMLLDAIDSIERSGGDLSDLRARVVAGFVTRDVVHATVREWVASKEGQDLLAASCDAWLKKASLNRPGMLR